jgi:hypothetical protein
MSTGLHRNLDISEIHRIHSWEYADAATRTSASGFISGDIGRVARQLDDGSFWVLMGISPTSWMKVGWATTKSGKALPASFAGNPKKATVTFDAAFLSADYSVTVTPLIATDGTTYHPNVESQTSASFVINMGTNNISSLTQVDWLAVLNGEYV